MHTILEFRNYTMVPGRRDELVALFHDHFQDALEALGMRIVGTFAVAGDPNRFVWIRSFPDMPARGAMLRAFYDQSPVWIAHRQAANDAMIDSDDVFLLRPVLPLTSAPGEAVIATIYPMPVGAEQDFAARLHEAPLAAFTTDHSPNNFRHPVRENETVFLTLSRAPIAAPGLPAPQATLRLIPTARSRLK